jgi:hypothetical protein
MTTNGTCVFEQQHGSVNRLPRAQRYLVRSVPHCLRTGQLAVASSVRATARVAGRTCLARSGAAVSGRPA